MGADWACDITGGYCQYCKINYNDGVVNMKEARLADTSQASGVAPTSIYNGGTTGTQLYYSYRGNYAQSACQYATYAGMGATKDCPQTVPGLCGGDYEWMPLGLASAIGTPYYNDANAQFAKTMRACAPAPANSLVRFMYHYSYPYFTQATGTLTRSSPHTLRNVICTPACYKNTPDATNTYCWKDQHEWKAPPASTADCKNADITKPYWNGSACVTPTSDGQCKVVDSTKPHYVSAAIGCVECTEDSHCSGATPYCDLGNYTCGGCKFIYQANTYFPTGDTCPTGQYCQHDVTQGTYQICNPGNTGTCKAIPAYETTVIDGVIWAAGKTNNGISNWSAWDICYKLGGAPATANDLCSSKSGLTCTTQLADDIKAAFYTNSTVKRGSSSFPALQNNPCYLTYFKYSSKESFSNTFGEYYPLCKNLPANTDELCAAVDNTKPVYDSTTGTCVEL